jgi:hypothetical protein
MNSISTNCKSSSTFGILSKVLLRYAKALWWLIAINAAKAFLLHVVSLSPARKFSINSGASGMRLSAIKSDQRSVCESVEGGILTMLEYTHNGENGVLSHVGMLFAN